MGQVEDMLPMITAVVAILGFAAVVVQLRVLTEQVRAAARGNIYDMASRLKELFVAQPQLRKYFMEGASVPEDHPDYPTAVAIADYYCLYLEQIATQSNSIAKSNRAAWLRYGAAVYRSSPIIRAYLSEAHRSMWYSEEFWSMVKSGDSTLAIEESAKQSADG